MLYIAKGFNVPFWNLEKMDVAIHKLSTTRYIVSYFIAWLLLQFLANLLKMCADVASRVVSSCRDLVKVGSRNRPSGNKS